MPSVCFYFQVHQPYRLKRFSYFDIGTSQDYFDEDLNRSIMRRVAENCYIPANARILRCIEESHGEFKVAFSISGVAVEMMRAYAPEALESFRVLARTGCVEFLGETYYHSLAWLYDKREFREQVRRHSNLIAEEFGSRPSVFRNTELIYNDELGKAVGDLGFAALLAEGAEDVLGWRSPNFMYKVPERGTKLLLKNFKLSDDIAFRFSSATHGESNTLSPARFAQMLHELDGNAELVGLFLDYETFGEHHRQDDGILKFLSEAPAHILSRKGWKFVTPSDAAKYLHPVAELSVPRTTSWADTARDVSAWCGNKMQQAALDAIYNPKKLLGGQDIYSASLEPMVEIWRRLQTSDHFYYMSTKGDDDGAVHSYFSPFQSPYDAFIAYMNVLKDLAWRSSSFQEGPQVASNE